MKALFCDEDKDEIRKSLYSDIDPVPSEVALYFLSRNKMGEIVFSTHLLDEEAKRGTPGEWVPLTLKTLALKAIVFFCFILQMFGDSGISGSHGRQMKYQSAQPRILIL
jgi:hypothetical protein